MYATITDQTLTIHDGTPSLAQMQEAVGGWITTALRVPSRERSNVSMDVYCNDEGLLLSLPIHWERNMDGSPLAGGLIITATDERSGDTIPATEAEIRSVFDHLTPVVPPVIDYTF